jgi:protein-S-isoprenylcysteine O-methyltransferase Ste14
VDATAVVGLLLALSMVAWFVLELRQSRRTRAGATDADRGSLAVLRVTAAVGFVLSALADRAVPAAAIPRENALGIGLALLWCGAALRWWSFRALGAYFTFAVRTSPDQPLVTDGPYRVVRHPAYLGMVLALLGVAMLFANWLGLVLVAIPVLVGLVYRIRVEERALEDELGERWTAYARTHSRLVPHVW